MRAMLALAIAHALLQDGSSGPPPIPDEQAVPVARYTAQHCSAPPVLDGALDDAAWAKVPWTSDFVDIEGSAKPTPRYRTRAKMLWDDKHFYIAAEMEEPDVWATLKRHDEIVFRDNDFEIFIDPDGDTREYYELEANAFGTIFDLFLPKTYIEGGPAVHSWNCKGLRTHIAIKGSLNDPRDEDRQWTLEWAIPWSALTPPAADDAGAPLPPSATEAVRAGKPPKPGDTWRVNFSRVQWKHNFEQLDAAGKRSGPKGRPPGPLPIDDSWTNQPPPRYEKVPDAKEDNWVWSPQGVIDMHRPERWGKVTFVREATPAAPEESPNDSPKPGSPPATPAR